MTYELRQLIEMAIDDCRPTFACFDGHMWESIGGRACPMGAIECGQAVYKCKRCDIYDYGYGKDSPGKKDCQAVCGDSMMGWKNGRLDPDHYPAWEP